MYTDSKIFTIHVSDHDVCCVSTNNKEVHKSEVDFHPCPAFSKFWWTCCTVLENKQENQISFVAMEGGARSTGPNNPYPPLQHVI